MFYAHDQNRPSVHPSIGEGGVFFHAIFPCLPFFPKATNRAIMREETKAKEKCQIEMEAAGMPGQKQLRFDRQKPNNRVEQPVC